MPLITAGRVRAGVCLVLSLIAGVAVCGAQPAIARQSTARASAARNRTGTPQIVPRACSLFSPSLVAGVFAKPVLVQRSPSYCEYRVVAPVNSTAYLGFTIVTTDATNFMQNSLANPLSKRTRLRNLGNTADCVQTPHFARGGYLNDVVVLRGSVAMSFGINGADKRDPGCTGLERLAAEVNARLR